jgi:RNA polymerase sigma factor for flagellar operon FliA
MTMAKLNIKKTFTPMISEEKAELLFKQYQITKDVKIRNQLVEGYQKLVEYNAERISLRLPDEVELDDLTSTGNFGLMDAIERFEPGRGVKFTTYAAPRIRGAILDELRSMDWVPRLVRSRSSKLETANKALEVILGRPPTDDELRGRLKVGDSELKKIKADGEAIGIVSLSRKWFETDSNKDVREVDILQDAKAVDPSKKMLESDLKRLVGAGLNRAEFMIIVLYYFEEMTMKDIGGVLDLSESRVSQMHSSILQRLRARLTMDENGRLRGIHEAAYRDEGVTPPAGLRLTKVKDEDKASPRLGWAGSRHIHLRTVVAA